MRLQLTCLLALSLIIAFHFGNGICYSSDLRLHLETSQGTSNYELPFESAYSYKKGDQVYLMISFFRPNIHGTVDSQERFNIYLIGSWKEFKDHSTEFTKGFFIGSDMYPWYGHLKAETLKVEKSDGHGFSITAEFSTASFLTDPDYYKMLQVSFSQISVIPLDSKDKLVKKDLLLEQSIIAEKFNEWATD